VDAAHVVGRELGEVVVHRHQMDTLATECVEVRGQGADEGLALTGLHLGDPAEVECGATHHLDVEVPLARHAGGGLAHHGERLCEDVVEVLAALEATTELRGLGAQRVVGERLHPRLEPVDVRDQALECLELLAFAGAKDAIEQFHADSSLPGACSRSPACPWRPGERCSTPR
jgi:hypothetical protein